MNEASRPAAQLTRRRAILAGFAGGAALAALALPPLAVVGAPIHGGILPILLVLLATTMGTAVSWWLGPRGIAWEIAGAAVAGLACWLMAWASFDGSVMVAGALLGFGLAQLVAFNVVRRTERRFPWTVSGEQVAGLIAGVVAIALARALGGTVGAAWAAGAMAGAGLAGTLLHGASAGPANARARTVAWPAVAVVFGVFAVFWVGSSSPAVPWFGSLTNHGPRSSREVALTFDDGPNGEYTLAIASILEAHGTRGTFFLVGKAVAKEPEVAKALVDRGHTIGNHSYLHDAWRYLDPRYPELDRADRAIVAAVGGCPAFFRPPHGTHTPFMSAKVEDDGMTLVTWDVSAKDWVETDAARLARNIVAKAQGGSIILLHDGIDGMPGADRSVVVEALPMILDGLAAKGLAPVTLDELLGKPKLNPVSACQ